MKVTVDEAVVQVVLDSGCVASVIYQDKLPTSVAIILNAIARPYKGPNSFHMDNVWHSYDRPACQLPLACHRLRAGSG